MSRTRTIFFVIVGLALIVILVGVAAYLLLGPSEIGQEGGSSGDEAPIEVTIVAALPVEPWEHSRVISNCKTASTGNIQIQESIFTTAASIFLIRCIPWTRT